MKKVIFPLLILALFSSCEEVFEKTIEYEIPEEPARQVIDTKLEAGKKPAVFISTSEYSMGQKDPKLDTLARVKLYENGSFIEELSPIGDGYYEGQYLTKYGQSYKVEAIRSGYETAYGESLIPLPAVITSGVLSRVDEEFKLEVTFADPPGQGDYYFFYVSLVQTGQEGGQRLYFHTLDPTVEVFESYDDPFEQEQGTFGDAGYISDQYFDGIHKKLVLTSVDRFGPGPIDSSYRVQFNLYRIGDDLYRHEKSKAAQRSSGDGLFAEPVQVYSNIRNGYGIVAGASRSFIEIKP